MSKKTPTRRLRVGLAMVTTKTSWADSQLVVLDYSRNCEVRLDISGPNDLSYIREKLTEIESYWRAQLESMR